MTVDDAYDDLYYLERNCQIQVTAMSTGRPLNRIPEATAQATSARFASLSKNAEAQFAALKDMLGALIIVTSGCFILRRAAVSHRDEKLADASEALDSERRDIDRRRPAGDEVGDDPSGH